MTFFYSTLVTVLQFTELEYNKVASYSLLNNGTILIYFKELYKQQCFKKCLIFIYTNTLQPMLLLI